MAVLDDQRWCTYAGVYQAFAWQQGAVGQPVTFRLPDENFMAVKPTAVFEQDGFNLVDFMYVAAEIDDGAIHYWHYYEAAGDRFIVLACTEDYSMNYLETALQGQYRTAHDVDYWKEVS